MTDDYRGLGWAHGSLAVQRLGAMLAPLTFVLPDGRQVSPMHVAPWAGEAEAERLPGVLRRLRGEWACAPFGYSAPLCETTARWAALAEQPEPDEESHGHSSNAEWNWEAADAGTLKLNLEYPVASPIRCVERVVTPDPRAAAVDLTFTIHVRTACRLPIGLHPVFRVPALAGSARVEPGRFDQGRTYPGVLEPGASFFAIDQRFSDLAAVPLRDGGVVDAARHPLARDSEELLQLNGIDGHCALANFAEGYRIRLSWQPEHFPSLLLWISNQGRKAHPWNSRHVALGIEPICSPFGLGPSVARAGNPISKSGTPTARAFGAGETFTTAYRIEAEPV